MPEKIRNKSCEMYNQLIKSLYKISCKKSDIKTSGTSEIYIEGEANCRVSVGLANKPA